jgi:5-amino-6-(5-phospho-D-ribitylamino)uracil phosphatase
VSPPRPLEAPAPAILAFDLDGTVLDGRDEAAPGIVRTLHDLAAAGVRLVPCTGRPLHRALKAAAALAVSPAACVAYHGALVVDLLSGERLRQLSLPGELASGLAASGLAAGLEVSLYIDDERLDLAPGWAPPVCPAPAVPGVPPVPDVLPASDTRAAPPARRASGTPAPADTPPGGSPGVTRLVVSGDPLSVTPAMALLAGARRAGLRVEHVRPGVVVVLPPGADKGDGLRLVADRFGVTSGRVVACGDDANDITLLLAAGHAIAVGDAQPLLRAVADVTVAQAGLAAALRDMFARLL